MIQTLRSVLAFAFLSFPAFASTTWYVDHDHCPDVGDGSQANPFCRIQDAITAAATSGDVLLVLPGVYLESLDNLEKSFTLASTQGPLVTTIDGNNAGRVVTLHGIATEDLVIDGFTITHGTDGMLVTRTATIRNCLITGNSTTGVLCLGMDAFRGPRLLDGRLSGSSSIDIGAHEFDHVRLDVTGTAQPCSSVLVETSGTPGLLVFLFLGTAPGLACNRLGAFFLDFASPHGMLPWGQIPSTRPVLIPCDLPTGEVVLQELALDLEPHAPLLALPAMSHMPAGNTSNVVQLRVP